MSDFSELVSRLNASVTAPSTEAITARVKADLEDLLGRGALVLPDIFVRRVRIATRAGCCIRTLTSGLPRSS